MKLASLKSGRDGELIERMVRAGCEGVELGTDGLVDAADVPLGRLATRVASFLRGKHTIVHGVSHSATFAKKANLIRTIEAAMDEAIERQGGAAW